HGAADFLRTLARETGIGLHDGLFAAGNVFLPRDETLARRCRDALVAELIEAGLRVAGWRSVPVDTAACGALALAAMPGIEQLFVECDGDDPQAFERALFLARRRSEIALRDVTGYYVVTLSAQLVGY